MNGWERRRIKTLAQNTFAISHLEESNASRASRRRLATVALAKVGLLNQLRASVGKPPFAWQPSQLLTFSPVSNMSQKFPAV